MNLIIHLGATGHKEDRGGLVNKLYAQLEDSHRVRSEQIVDLDTLNLTTKKGWAIRSANYGWNVQGLNLERDDVVNTDVKAVQRSAVKIHTKPENNVTSVSKLEENMKPMPHSSLRTAVMNKNIFQAIRREYKSLFDAYLTSNLITNSRCKDLFNANLNRFAAFLGSSTDAGLREVDIVSTSEFVQTLGLFVSTTAMKKQLQGADKAHFTAFTEVISSYSHNKFAQYVSQPVVRLLIRLLLEKVSIEGLVENHKILRANKDKYEDHIQYLLTSMNH